MPSLAGIAFTPRVSVQTAEFTADGALQDLSTNNGSVLTVTQDSGHYSADLDDNTADKTLHYHTDQGRLDYFTTGWPFEAIAYNVGIETAQGNQTAPTNSPTRINFAGLQVAHSTMSILTSSHMVAGHRGGNAGYTVEGKDTITGSSVVTDEGDNVAPNCRMDMRFVGNADKTITAYYKTPGAATWVLYAGTGNLTGTPASFPDTVNVGIITYAQNTSGVPFWGTCDKFTLVSR